MWLPRSIRGHDFIKPRGGNRVGERVSVVEGNKLERFNVVDSRAPLAIDHNLGLDRIGDVTLLVGEVMQVFLISG